MKNFITQIKPSHFFLITSLVFGIIFLVVTPPFQVPDEINHFYRSYQISDARIFPETTDNRLGGYVPASFVEITKPFLGVRWNMNSKTKFNTLKEQFSIPLNEDDKIFTDFPNTAMYSPVSYLPQSFPIFILKSLNFSPMFIFYGARVFTLLIWILGVWLAIKITPIYKWLLVLLALLPMSIFTNMSLSADVVTNILAFLLLAYFLKKSFSDEVFDLKSFLIVALLSILLASAKIVYTPIILLFLIIPIKKFRNTQTFYFYFFLIMIVGFGTALFWSKSANSLYIPYKDYNTAFRNDVDLVRDGGVQEQLDYILSHDLYILKVFVNSIFHSFDMYYRGYIGTFGWLDTKLPIWLIHISYILILFTAVYENNKSASFNIFQRIVILGSLTATIVLVLLSQHLSWDRVGSDVIPTVQGRYFIPAFPLLFFLFNNKTCNSQFATTIVVTLLSVFLLCFSTWTLYSRYYISPDFNTSIIQCDAEELTPDNLYKTTDPDIFLENGITQSDKHSRSGNHSAQLSPTTPYAFTCRIFNGEMGDVINIDVWRFGKSGDIILSGESGKSFYFSSSKAIETDSAGWEKIHFDYTLQSNMKGKEIGMYIYNHTNDTCYFDDLSISFHKLN